VVRGWTYKFFEACALCIAPLSCVLLFTQPLKAQDAAANEAIIRPPREHQEFLRQARDGELVRTGPAEKRTLKLAQIREDFRRIQSINAEKIRPAINSSSFDYEKIAKASSEIEHRAERLRTNLALPDSGTVSGQPVSLLYLEQVKRLDASIWSFVSNSIFRSTGVVDVQLAEKASQDLREIINISKWLKHNRN
jgi:hypothetical protein